MQQKLWAVGTEGTAHSAGSSVDSPTFQGMVFDCIITVGNVPVKLFLLFLASASNSA